jgi:hypothetical protein
MSSKGVPPPGIVNGSGIPPSGRMMKKLRRGEIMFGELFGIDICQTALSFPAFCKARQPVRKNGIRGNAAGLGPRSGIVPPAIEEGALS